MISILLATYNGEKYIHKSINSILEQTFPNWELLVGFNGTTDSSKNIVAQYADSRIKIFDYGDDKGKSKTLNKLLKEAKYDWIAIQDDDDMWLPKKLERQMKHINDFDVIGTQIVYVDVDDNPTGGPSLAKDDETIKNKSLAGTNQIANTSAILKKKYAEEIEGWKDGLDGIEDYDFWLRLMRNGCKFINTQSVEVMHRVHENSNFNTKKYDLTKIL